MKQVEHPVKHFYQSTSDNCTQTAFSILLSGYGEKINPTQIEDEVPPNGYSASEELLYSGTIALRLVPYCIQLGYKVKIYSFDYQMLDLSWKDLSKSKVLVRLKIAQKEMDVFGDKRYSEQFIQAYIDALNAGATLEIKPYVSSKMLYKVLRNGPVLTAVQSNVFYDSGKYKYIENSRRTENDDINGIVGTHSMVLFGYDRDGNFLVSDPNDKHGTYTVDKEWLLASMTAATVDNYIITLSK